MEIDWFNQPQWKGSLEWEALFLNDTFPSAPAYAASLWAEWERRVEDGEKAELDRVSEMQKHWEQRSKGRPPETLPDELADSFADNAFQAIRLTRSMYAAIVVSMWSDMESFLKRIAFVSHRALGLKSKISFKFGDLKDFFSDNLGIDLSAIDGYSRIDAVRILNNSFKHSDGHYKPEAGKRHTQIEQTLLDSWAALDDTWTAHGGGYVIEYEKLPINDLVVACNEFCSGLLAAVRAQLTARLPNSP